MKYLHFMPVPGSGYNYGIVKMIWEDSAFDETEHTFLFTTKVGYEASKQYTNVLLNESLTIRQLVKLADEYDYLLVHGMNINLLQQMWIPARCAKKIIWSTWGHDTYFARKIEPGAHCPKLKNFLKQCLVKHVNIPLVQKFFCICYGFPYDAVELRTVYGSNVRLHQAAYVTTSSDVVVDIARELPPRPLWKDRAPDAPVKIMVGHSAYPFLQHRKILDALCAYKDENIVVYLPLSYGEPAYRDALLQELESYPFPIEPLLASLPMEDYVSYVNQMDMVILDFPHQAALGTVFLLRCLAKKIYVDPNGVVAKGCAELGKHLQDATRIGKVSFKELCAEIGAEPEEDMQQEIQFYIDWNDPKRIYQQWANLFTLCREAKPGR